MPSLQLSLGAPPRQPAPPALSALQDHPLPGDLGVRAAPGIERRDPDISSFVSPVLGLAHPLPVFLKSPRPTKPLIWRSPYPITFKPPITLEAWEAILSLNGREYGGQRSGFQGRDTGRTPYLGFPQAKNPLPSHLLAFLPLKTPIARGTLKNNKSSQFPPQLKKGPKLSPLPKNRQNNPKRILNWSRLGAASEEIIFPQSLLI